MDKHKNNMTHAFVRRAGGVSPLVAPSILGASTRHARHRQRNSRGGCVSRDACANQGAGTDSKRIGPPRSPQLRAALSQIRNPKSEIRNQFRAFTLVEMIVAVGLIMLMMVLFATIFQLATGAMST